MKVVFSISLVFLSYLLLSIGGDYISFWLCALIAAALVVSAILVLLYNPKNDAVAFRSIGLFKGANFTVLGGVLLMLLGAVFLAFWVGPSLAMEFRERTLFGSGYADEWSDKGYEDEESGYFGESNNLVVGNDEASQIRIPSQGGPRFKPYPEVWIKAKDEKSRDVLLDGNLYLRLKNFDNFDGRSGWTSIDASSDFTRAKDGWIITNNDPTERSAHYEVTHSADYRLLHAIQGLERVKVQSLKGYGGVGYSLPLLNDLETDQRSYECISSPKKFSDFSQSQLKELKVAESDEQYLSNTFQNSLRVRIEGLVEDFSSMGLTTPGEKIRAVQQFLKNQYSYSLDVKNASQNPPIENFLFFEKEGYCLHFSTAAVLLCRELGIPARMASGYCGGTYFPKKETWVFYTNNAHSWLEVNLDGYGWVVVETTPAQGIQASEATPSDEPSSLLTAEERAEMKEDIYETSGYMEAVYEEVKVVLFVIAILFVILLGVVTVQKREVKKRRRLRNESDERVSFEERPYLATYRSIAQLNGLPMFDGDTLAAHISWLSEKGIVPDFADDLLTYHYDSTYGDEGQDERVEEMLLKKIRKWKV